MNLLEKQYSQIFKNVKLTRIQQAKKILNSQYLEHNNKKMRFKYFIHGQKPENGFRLVFGLHGGGGCPSQVNQQQFNNHKHLYDSCLPPGTLWFVFRSAQQASDMWWKPYVPEFITIIIQSFTILDMIDTNKVFITGYSAGGDGIYHLATMMSDCLAGAAMMAGHPNKVQVWNLRNLTFSIHVGQTDNAYDRANWGKVYIQKINNYAKEYGGFKQFSQIHHNTSHWMKKQEAKIFPLFFNEMRQPYPEFILFKQHPRTFKKTFYYIKVEQKFNGIICVRRKFNLIQIQSEIFPVTLMLNRYFIDFNQELTIIHNGQVTVKRKPQINKKLVYQTIQQNMDPWFIFEDQIISIPNKTPAHKTLLKPFQYQNTISNIEKIKYIDQNIVQDEKLHVSHIKNTKHPIQKGLNKIHDQLQNCLIY